MPTTTTVRLDKWLWAARFFKTRSLAAEAIRGGKVEVNGVRAKPAKTVCEGDRVSVRRGPYRYVVDVQRASERRGPAAEALELYAETAQSLSEREAVAARLEADRAARPRPRGRPGKRDRRALVRFKQAGE